MKAARSDVPLVLAVAAELVVLLLLPRVVTVDGPAHLAGGFVLAHPHDPVLQQWYRIDLSPVPNLLASLLLAGLLRVLGPDGAEKALVAGYVVLLPLGLRYALRGVDPRAGWLAVVAVPITAHYLWTYGFYDLCLGLALSLGVVGLALRRGEGWRARDAGGLAVLLLLTWSAHLLPFLVAGLLVGVLALVRARRARAVRAHLLPVVLAALPSLALTAHFAVSDAAARGAPTSQSVASRLAGLLSLRTPVVAYARAEAWPAAVLAAVLLGLAVAAVRHERSPERTALALTGLLVTAWYVVTPESYGPAYGFLGERLSLFPPLLLLLWSAGPPPRVALRVPVVTAVLGSAVALQLLRLPVETRYQHEVSELLSVADAVPQGSVVVQVQLWRDPPGVRNPYRDALRHELGRVAVLRDAVDAGHYEAELPYFPTRFRAGTDPRRAVDPTGSGLDAVPPTGLDLAAPVLDAVVVVGRQHASAVALAAAASELAQLRAGYREVAVSRPTALAEVWVRR